MDYFAHIMENKVSIAIIQPLHSKSFSNDVMYYIENNYVKTIRAVIGDFFFNDIGPEFASE